jgi:hypothetical protein
MSSQELRVVSGAVIAYRLFDIADTIDLAQAEVLWSRQQPLPSATRARLVTTAPKAVAFGVPPLDIPLETIVVRLPQAEIRAEASARLYEFGVARLALRISADDLSWTEFVHRLNAVDETAGPASGTDLWQGLLDQLIGTFRPALLRPPGTILQEDYLIGFVRAFDTALDAETLQRRIDLVPLLSGEDRPLSDPARRDLLRQQFSYYTDDLVVLTWDRAFVYEPRGDSDVMDVLDVANARLLEMRFYDQLLQAELPRMYDLVEEARRSRTLMGSRRFANLARRLYTLVAEVSEVREKVDNALQVTEDVYLARVYAAALDLFRVDAVGASVERKLGMIRDTYAALYEEASASRSALMEAAIIALIVVEIALVFVHP